ncbi:MAG: hypothetical protein AAF411_22045 [Myxococcota bacterium]
MMAFCTATVAAQIAQRRMGVRWQNGVPRISVGIRDLVNARVREELRSGLRKRIVVRAQAFREGNSRPLATRTFSCAVTYDIWEQSFDVNIGRRRERFARVEQVIDRCLAINGMPVGEANDYANVRGRDIYFAVRAEFDPIDEGRCRQLLRSSDGGGDPIGPLVINIVRREICQADRVVEFRSPTRRVP